MKFIFVMLLSVLVAPLLAQQTIPLSLKASPEKVTMFGEGLISTMINERDFALSPDGRELYYTISTPKSTFQTIVVSRKINEHEWTTPEVVSFAGEFSDLEPAISADGKTMYFSSNRPLTGNKPKDFDIWKVIRSGNEWSTPENLGVIINTDGDEFYPSITRNGNLYFTAAYPGGIGKEDIYLSRFTATGYQKPAVLDTAVNSQLYEFNAFVSPLEDYILFTSYGRKDDAGGGDLYISTKSKVGTWQKAVNLKSINSAQLDYCPFVSPDGKHLFFTSERHGLPVSFLNSKATYKNVNDFSHSLLNGTGNIYWIDFQKVLDAVK